MGFLRDQGSFMRAGIALMRSREHNKILDTVAPTDIAKGYLEIIKADMLDLPHSEVYGLDAFRACEEYCSRYACGWLLLSKHDGLFWYPFRNVDNLLAVSLPGGAGYERYQLNDTRVIAYYE
jgi:hypothetical protein